MCAASVCAVCGAGASCPLGVIIIGESGVKNGNAEAAGKEKAGD